MKTLSKLVLISVLFLCGYAAGIESINAKGDIASQELEYVSSGGVASSFEEDVAYNVTLPEVEVVAKNKSINHDTSQISKKIPEKKDLAENVRSNETVIQPIPVQVRGVTVDEVSIPEIKINSNFT